MSRTRIIILLSLFAIGLFLSLDAEAQCAMCKAVAESGTDDGGESVSKGLNNGILYLMGIPYVLLITLFAVFFRKKFRSFLREFLSA